MATISEVETALYSVTERFLELNNDDIKKLIDGCGCEKNKMTKCLFFLKEALQDRYDLGVYDQTTEDLVNMVELLVGIESDTFIEWGYFDLQPDPNTVIPFQFTQSVPEGAMSYGMNFTAVADTKWLAVRELSTEPVKSVWFNTTFNNGVIPDQIWLSPQIVGLYRYYISRTTVVVDSGSPIINFST